MRNVALIAWDFDGVLNRNIIDGQFLWAENFEADTGVPRAEFQEYLFRSGRFAEVLVGKRDILDLVSEWVDISRCVMPPNVLIDYWFNRDCFVDEEIRSLLDDSRFHHVIATNNEARRVDFIAKGMGFAGLVERIFASGPMGVAKPDPQFFEQIENWCDCPADQILLVDDLETNTQAAALRGWQVFHYTGANRARFLEMMAT